MPVPIRHRNLPLLLLQAREAVISHFRPLLNHFGLTEQQWRVIRVLEEKGNLSPGRSPSAARSSSPASPGCSRAWKRSGWCNGVGWTLTRRRLLVSNTRKSSELVRAMAPLVEQQYRNLERALGAGLVEELYAMLDRLLAAGHDRVVPVRLPAGPRRARPARTSPRAPAVSRPG